MTIYLNFFCIGLHSHKIVNIFQWVGKYIYDCLICEVNRYKKKHQQKMGHYSVQRANVFAKTAGNSVNVGGAIFSFI